MCSRVVETIIIDFSENILIKWWGRLLQRRPMVIMNLQEAAALQAVLLLKMSRLRQSMEPRSRPLPPLVLLLAYKQITCSTRIWRPPHLVAAPLLIIIMPLTLRSQSRCSRWVPRRSWLFKWPNSPACARLTPPIQVHLVTIIWWL